MILGDNIFVIVAKRQVGYVEHNEDSIEAIKREVKSVSYMNINQLKDVIRKDFIHKAHLKIIERVLDYKKM